MNKLELKKIIDSLNDEELLQLHYLVKFNVDMRIVKRNAAGYLSYNEAKKITNKVDWAKIIEQLKENGATGNTEGLMKQAYEYWWDNNKLWNQLRGIPRNPNEVYKK